MTETWVDIYHFQNYEASDLGNIRNKKTKRIITPKLWKTTGEYKVIMTLNNDKYTRNLSTVIFTSLSEDYNKITDYETRYKIKLEHIDGDKSNNRYDNLRINNL